MTDADVLVKSQGATVELSKSNMQNLISQCWPTCEKKVSPPNASPRPTLTQVI